MGAVLVTKNERYIWHGHFVAHDLFHSGLHGAMEESTLGLGYLWQRDATSIHEAVML